MDDREIVAAIAAGDPAGLAAAYDQHAASLYGYCRQMLRDAPAAADAVQDTFVIASAEAARLDDPGTLRSWLFRNAREQCLRRPLAAPTAAEPDALADTGPADTGPADAERAELRALVRGTLAELEPDQREAIELRLWHDLDDADLAEVLGVTQPRAYALAAAGRSQLEKTLGTLRIARSGREACPDLGALLADWDGRLTVAIIHRLGTHVEHCPTCASSKRGKLRPDALARLLPLAEPPAGLRDQILGLCADTSPDAVAYRQDVTQRAESLAPARFAPPDDSAVPASGTGGARAAGQARSAGRARAAGRARTAGWAGRAGAWAHRAGGIGVWGRTGGQALFAALARLAAAAWSRARGKPKITGTVALAVVAVAVILPLLMAGGAPSARDLVSRTGTGTATGQGASLSANDGAPGGDTASPSAGASGSSAQTGLPTAAAVLAPVPSRAAAKAAPSGSRPAKAKPSASGSATPSPSDSDPWPTPRPTRGTPSPTPTPTPTHSTPTATATPTPTPTKTATPAPSKS